MKHILVALTLLAASSASAEMLGIANSSDKYAVSRKDAVLKNAPQVMAPVQSGDKVVAMKAPVKVQTLDGGVVIVGQDSEASFVKPGVVRVENGTLIMTVGPKSKDTEILYRELSITPSQSASLERGNKPTIAAINAKGDSLQVSTSGQPFEVRDKESKQLLATVDDKAPANFTLEQDGKWNKVAAASVPPGSLFVLQQQGGYPAQDSDAKGAGFVGAAAASAAGAGGGAAGASMTTVGAASGVAVGGGSMFLFGDKGTTEEGEDPCQCDCRPFTSPVVQK